LEAVGPSTPSNEKWKMRNGKWKMEKGFFPTMRAELNGSRTERIRFPIHI
jgi:hypothetical protein